MTRPVLSAKLPYTCPIPTFMEGSSISASGKEPESAKLIMSYLSFLTLKFPGQ
jgi:hypothetical protein